MLYETVKVMSNACELHLFEQISMFSIDKFVLVQFLRPNFVCPCSQVVLQTDLVRLNEYPRYLMFDSYKRSLRALRLRLHLQVPANQLLGV